MADNNTSLSVLRKIPLSNAVATQEWTKENFTPLSTMVSELSGNINPKLSTIADLVEEETAKVDEISSSLTGYALKSELPEVGKLNTTLTATQATNAAESLSGTVNLHKVAKTGSYNDLLNKPTIPTVNNAALTIQKNGSTLTSFTANSSTAVTANITVPTKTSDLTNDSGFLTSADTVKTMVYQGTKTTYAELPSSGNKQGDVWNVVSAYNGNPPGTNYAWSGTSWDPLGGSIDVSVFALKSEIPEVSLDAEAHSITVNDITADIPYVQTGENALTVNGTSYYIPNIQADGSGRELTVNGTSYIIPEVSLDGNSLMVNGSYATIPDVQNDETGNSLTVNSTIYNIPDVQSDGTGNSLTVNSTIYNIPNVYLNGNSLTVNENNVSIPNVNLDGHSLTVNENYVTIPAVYLVGNSLTVDSSAITIPLSTSQLINDSGFLTSVGDLDTSASNSLTPSNKESFSGTISLHRISKTGSYNDLLDKPNLSVYVLSSDFKDLISTLTDELSNNINPKLSSIGDQVSAEVMKLDAVSTDVQTLSTSLTGYALTSQIPVVGHLNTTLTSTQTTNASESLTGTVNLHKVSKTGSYNDLLNKPTIPTKTSDLTNDSRFITEADVPLSDYTPLSTTLILSDEVVYEISNVINPKLNTIVSLVSGEVEKLDELSGKLDDYALTSDIPLSTSQLINDSGYITSSYVSLSAVEKSSTLVLTEEQKAALVQASGIPVEAYGDFAISVRTTDGMGYIGPIDCFSAVENENGDWVFVGGMPSLNALGWVANSTVIQETKIHTILSVDNVSADIATKDELAGYLPLNGGGVVTGNVAIQNLDGDSLFSLNNYGKVTIGVGASIHPNAQYGVAIGENAYAANSGIAINGGAVHEGISANSYCIAIGDSVVSGGYDSIQLGYANNNSDALFRVWKYPMLEGNGDIPYGRLSANTDKLNILPITSTTDASIALTKNTYVYRITDSNNTGTFPTLVAPADIVQTGDYYFTFEIEWTTAASVGSYSGGYDWITYPEFAGDGSTYTYYIAGRWDSSGSGGSAFTLNCWRAKKLTA